MRFALKIVCVSIMAVALALSLGAAMLVQLSFEQSLSRETQRALDEQSLLKMGLKPPPSPTPSRTSTWT